MPPKGALLAALDGIHWVTEKRTDEQILQDLRKEGLVTEREERFLPNEISKRR